MTPLLELVPLEIIDYIIDIAASGDNQNHQTLKACSLTCQTFLPRSRQHILYSIKIDMEKDSEVPYKFSEVIRDAPGIAGHVQKLRCLSLTVGALNHPLMSSALNSFTKLHTFVLHLVDENGSVLWTDVCPSGQLALLRLMHLPTVVCLKFENLDDLPASNFAKCTNLKHLSLIQVKLTGIHDTSSSDLLQAIKLERLQLNNPSAQDMSTLLQNAPISGMPIFDLREVKHISVVSSTLPQLVEEAFSGILKRTRHPEIFDIQVQGIGGTSGMASLLTTSLDSLRVINININGLNNFTMGRLCIELERTAAAGRNRIESLTVNILCSDQTKVYSVRCNDWHWLDSVFRAPDLRWPSLRRVDFTVYIECNDEFTKHIRALEESLRKAYDSHLSRLATNTFFDFNFSFSRHSDEYMKKIAIV